MKNEIKKNRQWHFQFALLLLIPIVFGFTNPKAIETICPGPQVSVTNQSSGTASFSWNAVSGASGYVVSYMRQSDQYSSPQTYTTNTSITYSGLPSGTYNFYFTTVCGSGYSEVIIIEDLVI